MFGFAGTLCLLSKPDQLFHNAILPNDRLSVKRNGLGSIGADFHLSTSFGCAESE
jgi:hypothetical protein